MSTTYAYTQSVNDADRVFSYVQASFPAASSCTYDGQTLKFTFSVALSAASQTALTALLAAYVNPITIEEQTTANQSTFNSTSALLAAGAVYTGTWEDVSLHTSLRITALSDAPGTLAVQFGILAAQPDITKTYSSSQQQTVSTTTVLGRYFRVVYTNGAAAVQTSFQLSTYWSINSIMASGQTSEVVTDSSDSILSRALVAGRADYQRYQSVRVDEQNLLRVRPPTAFERHVFAESVPMIQLAFTYGINTDVVDTALVASGTATGSGGRALLSTAAAINSSATLSSHRLVRCAVGNTVMLVVSCAFVGARAGSTQICGAGTSTNGLFIGYNGTVFGAMVRSNGVSTWTASTAFNVDRVDGTENSGILLNPLNGNTFVITYDCTGYGNANFYVLSPLAITSPVTSLAECVLMHRVSFGNTSATTGLLNPQFPLMASVANTTNTTAVTLYVSGLAAFVDGPQQQPTLTKSIDSYRTVSTVTYVPLITLQNKATFQGVTNTVTVQLRSLCIAIAAVKVNMVVSIIENPTFGIAPTYTDMSTATSVIAYNTAATTTITANTGEFQFSCSTFSNDCVLDLTPYLLMLGPGNVYCIAAKLSAANTQNVTTTVTTCEYQ